MTKAKQISIFILTAILLVGLVVGIVAATKNRQANTCKGYVIKIENSGNKMLKEGVVKDFIKTRNLDPTGQVCDSVDLEKIERELSTIPLVSEVECYMLENGKMMVEIGERMPLFHVKTNISDYCIDTKGQQMNTPKNLPEGIFKVTGDVTLEYAMQSLFPIIKYVTEDKAFAGEFHSMKVGGGNQISMKSKKFDYTVVLGTAERYEQKLDKLIRFRQYDKTGERQKMYKQIDLQFRGQVVCKKK